jgi:hypothetical protein
MQKKNILLVLLNFLFTAGVWAQYDVEEKMNNSLAQQTKNDLVVIGVAGTAGAVLGLSTLSFTDKPSDHLDNIYTGAALGVIAGVLYVAYEQAFGTVAQTNFTPNLMVEDFWSTSRRNTLALNSPSEAFQYNWNF